MKIPKIGKMPKNFFDEVIYPNLGSKDERVVVGPQHGVDFGVIEVGEHVIINTSDPVFVVPEYGWERSGWFAVHILASDEVVSGVPPKYLSIDLNLPPDIDMDHLRTLWRTISEECKKLGISITSGHTGRYENCDYPMVGGATLLGIGEKEGYVTPKMAREGDKIFITKGPAIETTGILATMFPQVLEETYGSSFVKRAQAVFWEQSVVKEALLANKVGLRENGVTSMHDGTEYGVWGGLIEMARASNVNFEIQEEQLHVKEAVRKTVKRFSELTGVDINPFEAISEGTLLGTVRPKKAELLVENIRREGIDVWIIGEVTSGGGNVFLKDKRGNKRKIEYPEQDPFWLAFYKTIDVLSQE
ncbi:MAG: AIR synthase [Candidatus Korarchaeota archaeon]|nr:AIR synthase [Candidatus Korarchaeota archaeon]NIU85078.1 AIR synthase [Candidatus Thorarchaeota archaeon]NIW15739.1 AIR synthase [Candidatus Thorarchaeota archaeon]NIW53661.1 AIR synthase [Candidatus Korarchaeota archaeon]